MWTNNFGDAFNCKADGFKWLNEVQPGIDMPVIMCDGEKRYTKTPFGIYDCYFQSYVNGKLPVEYYD